MTIPERIRPRREDVRAQILDAAVEVFYREGYGAASIQKIAHQAGFTKGAIYSNFDSKQALFGAIMRARFSEVSSAVLAGIEPTDSGWHAAVDQAATLLARHIATLGGLHALVIEFALQASRDPDAREVYLELRRAQRLELSQALRERAASFGLAEDSDYDQVATTILALISGLTLERIVDPALQTENIIRDALRGALSAAGA
jgi:AcrR family transcriptional regulator